MIYYKKIISRLTAIAIALCIPVFCFCNASLYTETVTEESIKEKEDQISSAKEEREAMQNSVTELKKLKENLQASKDDLDAYVSQLDASLTEIQSKIDSLEKDIEDKEQEIENTEAELEEAQQKQQDQYDAMKDRIKFIYEKGDTLFLDILFDSGSFADMLNKTAYVEAISAYDRNKLDEYTRTAKYVALTKEALEEEKTTLDEAKKTVDAEEANMQELINDKSVEISGLSSDIATQQSAIDDYEASISEQNDTIAALEKAVKEDRAKLTEQQKARQYDGGMFTWPCPSYTRVSDDYGMRMHPTLHVEKFHNGIDLAAPAGSSILAAYDGTVVAASYSSSMGNYVMIDHGGSLYTLYMHASALYVSEGQDVTKGQTIAAVGSTGRSTGNHLHFGVRLNGEYVSPWNYLSN